MQHALWSLLSILGCLLVSTKARNWTVRAPWLPPLLISDGDRVTGLLPQLLNVTNDAADDRFNIVPSDEWFNSTVTASNITVFDQGAINCLMKAREMNEAAEICLFQSTPYALTALQALWNSTDDDRIMSNMPALVTPWLQLKPALLVRCVGGACFAPTFAPSTLQAMYFCRVFHSSVWSLLFLFALTAASLLFVYEFTHPFEMGMQHRSGTYEGCFNLLECFLFVFTAMFLQPFKKSPKSWAGIVLVLFWYAFALICVIAYAAGTYQLIFQPVEQIPDARLPQVPSNKSIMCEPYNLWCQLLKSTTNRTVEPLELNRDAFGRVDPSKWSNNTHVILVDHVTAKQIEGYKYMDDSNRTVRWLETKMECRETEASLWNLPIIWWTFMATESSSAWAMNYYMQKLSTSGEQQRVLNQWLEPTFRTSTVCLSHGGNLSGIPIRLAQMNGPLLFMISGALASVIAHLAEFIYLSFIVKSASKSRPSEGWEHLT